MKRLNKITLILVAVMGIVISGCGGDIKKAPFVERINAYNHTRDEKLKIIFASPCRYENFKTEKEFNKCVENVWVKMNNDLKVINLKGRRDCGKSPRKVKDCPPKNRLDNESYSFTLKTKFGTFKYDTSDKSTKTKYGYAPIGYKGGNK